ncbi:hypothetical protein BDV36DRAFT_289884 [Aspergillus pseudocaelatus]|uniref:Uncharacterized protein n=1 Tax=Aspergillus pseudocaelatus TaxID=1825620 RepID=A0ABQ6X542_9EURO|nr:hypothetical protein BDV36DRAFT_289884 [Aspergillus pseudocaelatus]
MTAAVAAVQTEAVGMFTLLKLKPTTSLRPNADISLVFDRITELSQYATVLTGKLFASIYQNDPGRLSPLGDIDDMIRLQFMLSEEISRLYTILHHQGQSSTPVL